MWLWARAIAEPWQLTFSWLSLSDRWIDACTFDAFSSSHERIGRVLELDRFERRVISRRLVEVPVNAYVSHGYC